MIITADRIVNDQGSIVVFGGVTSKGRGVNFAVDHRMAQGLAELIEEKGAVDCDVESWQILG